MSQTVLDRLFADFTITYQRQSAIVAPDDLVHVVGTQEPVRDQPDDRARMLLGAGWLKIESIRTEMSEPERSNQVSSVQQAARTWQKQSAGSASAAEKEQVRWLLEKTRPRESKQQIAQRVWLALVLYGLGHRELRFDQDGQILWEDGVTGRIGLSPDAVLDLAWSQKDHQTYTASFRRPDGTITRGKGRHRWYIYRLTIDPAASFLFERRAKKVKERVALIVASETFATQPQLPRDFYGGDSFQQACIDAQDQQFDHILVLSPEHGVVSLDDVVSSEQSWDEVLERRIWAWQIMVVQRLGGYMFGDRAADIPKVKDINWWAWLNPESTYELTVFGSGFAIRILIDLLSRSRARSPLLWPQLVFADRRAGYDVGDIDDEYDFDFDAEDEDEEPDWETSAMQDLDQLLEWSSELVDLINIYVAPISETWELAPDEALIPVRLLTETGMDIEDLLDLLTDMTLLLEQPLPLSLIINAGMVVSVLLQISHSLVHDERDAIPDLLNTFQEDVLHQYIEKVMQEPSLEDRLCACLTLAEQMHLLALTISPSISDQLLVWLQTYLSARMRQHILNGLDEDDDEDDL